MIFWKYKTWQKYRQILLLCVLGLYSFFLCALLCQNITLIICQYLFTLIYYLDMNKKIIIVDDHALFREGIKLLIENEGLGKVIAEAANGQEFLELLTNMQPDLVIMDIEMPTMGGLEATLLAKKQYPDLKFLVLTMLSEKDNYSDMVAAGVMGFVLKTAGKAEFERAIKSIIGGETYFSNELLRQIIAQGNQQNNNLSDKLGLSSKEKEVLTLFCEGFSANEIAEKLFRSIKTIEAHRANILEKTNTKNTLNLVLFAIKNGLVEI